MTTTLESLAAKWDAAEFQDTTFRECAAELRAALARGGWQPIETAPKDGTTVLCWRPEQGSFEAKWFVDDFDDPPFEAWIDPWADEEVAPTHWMPRLEPPR